MPLAGGRRGLQHLQAVAAIAWHGQVGGAHHPHLAVIVSKNKRWLPLQKGCGSPPSSAVHSPHMCSSGPDAPHCMKASHRSGCRMVIPTGRELHRLARGPGGAGRALEGAAVLDDTVVVPEDAADCLPPRWRWLTRACVDVKGRGVAEVEMAEVGWAVLLDASGCSEGPVSLAGVDAEKAGVARMSKSTSSIEGRCCEAEARLSWE